MTDIKIYSDPASLAAAVANQSIAIIRQSIADNGQCVWVLAGGSTPQLAYQVMVDKYLEAIDWSGVTILMGDERIAPLDSADSNWHQAEQSLLRYIPQAKLLRPQSDQSLDVAVKHYQQVVDSLPKGPSGAPHFDLVWLGVGEDGHTLSLFPGSADLDSGGDLVLPIDDSPKPPAERLTLGIGALRSTANLFIMATGLTKADVIAGAIDGEPLPIAVAAQAVDASGGGVTWWLDQSAGSRLRRIP